MNAGVLAALLILQIASFGFNGNSFSMREAEATFPGINGKIAFQSHRDGNGEIYVMDANGGAQTRLTNNPAFDFTPSWSPDGTKIAFASTRDSGNQEIYVMDANGGAQTRLTNNPAFDFTPSWSPDGTKIAFASTRDSGNGEIYVMDANGGAQTRLTNNPAGNADPSWQAATPPIDWTRILESAEKRRQIYLLYSDKAFNSGYWNGLADSALAETGFFNPLQGAIDDYNESLIDSLGAPFGFDLLRLSITLRDLIQTLIGVVAFEIGSLIMEGETAYPVHTKLGDLVMASRDVIIAAHEKNPAALDESLQREKILIEDIYVHSVNFDVQVQRMLNVVAFFHEGDLFTFIRGNIELLRTQLEKSYSDITNQLGSVKDLKNEKPAPLQNMLIVEGKSPINLLMEDPAHRRAGFDPETDLTLNEIPNAFYNGANTEPQTLVIVSPLEGNYKVIITGTGTGSYTLVVSTSEEGVTNEFQISGIIAEGAILAYSFSSTATELQVKPDPISELESLNAFIDGLPPESFAKKSDNLKKTLTNKINTIIKKIHEGENDDALEKLLVDIKPKIDGQPKPKDWIIDTHTQNTLTVWIDQIVLHINELPLSDLDSKDDDGDEDDENEDDKDRNDDRKKDRNDD